MKQEKVLFLITKSNFGGAQRYVFDLATAMKGGGHDVVVAFGGTGEKHAEIGALDKMLIEHGVRTIHVKSFMRDVSLLQDARAIFELIGILLREKPNVLHASSSKAGGLGAFAGRVSGIRKIIFTSHGLTFNESWRPKWERLMIKYFTWLTMTLAHMSIMISTETYELARALPLLKNKVVLIHNGIRPLELCDRESARSALDINHLSKGALILGTIAELHPNKNIAAVLEALHTLPPAYAHLHFVVIGGGELQTELETKTKTYGLEKRVHFLGNVPNAATYLAALDMFILPSFKEGLPYVLLEAGYAGLPVIASNIHGNTDIIEHGENGLLIDPFKVEAITAAIKQLASDNLYRSKLGKELHKSIITGFTLKHMVEKTLHVYEE